ncbi:MULTISPECIES: cobalt-precorrin-5B (C(1))-methyltransferase CbiD [Limosilactobacillus]|uniref:cobalt-precorrin-5B (C(1))-methyltransferase CbiD n=1 Tax=Limosilactobacillus TaxID=2742598 RepID=UPI00128C2983|nr:MULTISPECIES: cobalt-precorrin-5B (C(1))-methyltransferase CbiD [Limosilactobacillus]MCC4486522.1 cobalt-precorrin-5B (C(1))-methyltransferase CbiD [Limosilactobacillus reuteri]MQB68849.1 cobalt-precorrin-5B (C(1))-methyltransferase [Limosilactobacillus reuteri]MQB70465.1 cobalt-precorrin-5B (C(1))-methyltransferase [Limosilactobacillus reuteri]MQB83800.1 cobalt-precorrin-5B (C(1))-methyltransferase [Limosilactobacillus reuteri]MQB94858.1 cobalt-precorrin-5B (C(1))-methyltransferase [Limosi
MAVTPNNNSEDNYVYYNGRKLRKGFTTGTTATAATVAAIRTLLNQEPQETVTVHAANGKIAIFDVEQTDFDEQQASCAIKKDGGDDQDATDGTLIFATVKLRDDNEIHLDGGKGVGRVTKEGLANKPGMPAINPTPRRVIKAAAREELGEKRGVDIVISVPEGERIAKLTYNPRLGIVGGISILGTSGVVTPMSESSWKHSISIEMNIHRKRGDNTIVLVPGNYGEDFAKDELGIPNAKIVQMSNFVGYVLHETQRLGFTKVLIVGDLGKMIKVAGGIFSTHSKDADARAEIMVANLALMGGVPTAFLRKINQCLTTISMIKMIDEAGYQDVYQMIADKIKLRAEKLLAHREPHVEIDAVIFSRESGFLAASKPFQEIKGEWQ